MANEERRRGRGDKVALIVWETGETCGRKFRRRSAWARILSGRDISRFIQMRAGVWDICGRGWGRDTDRESARIKVRKREGERHRAVKWERFSQETDKLLRGRRGGGGARRSRCGIAEKEPMTDILLFSAFVFNERQRDMRCTYVTSCSPLISPVPCYCNIDKWGMGDVGEPSGYRNVEIERRERSGGEQCERKGIRFLFWEWERQKKGMQRRWWAE